MVSVCLKCGFELYNPVASLKLSDWGIYNDARFPGRSIVSLREHNTHEETVPSALMGAFMAEVQHVSRVIKAVTGCERVNIALLGNTVHHVHAHLIPRHPESEPNPEKSPWDDPREKETLSEAELKKMAHQFLFRHVQMKKLPYQKVSRNVTFTCTECGWSKTVPEAEEENGYQEWCEHYEEECECAAFNCHTPRTSMSQLCDWHDVNGEEYGDLVY